MLGPLEVVTATGSVAPAGQRERVMLAVLLLDPGRTVSTDRLIDALWGEDPPASANKILQNVVLRLRRSFGTSIVATRSGGYAIDTTAGTTDVVELEALVAEARSFARSLDRAAAVSTYDAALGLWRGSPFEDLAEWIPGRAEAARLEELKRGVAEELAEVQLAMGRHHECIGDFELLAGEEPLREKRWELLALAMYRDGRQADAMRAFQRAREHLADVGLDVSPSMRDLERAISAQDPALLRTAEDPVRRRSPSTGPRSSAAQDLSPELQIQPATAFAGRAKEMEQLDDSWKAALNGRRRTVLISGEAGIGKSRLAVEFCRACHAGGAIVLSGLCESDVGLGYQPWIDVVEQVAWAMTPAERAEFEAELSDLSIVVPSLERLLPNIQRSPLMDPDAQRLRLFAALNEVLVHLAIGQPVILLIEDIHWAGSQTLALLSHLARIKDDARLMMIATLRDGVDEITDSLASLLGELRRSDQVERLSVGRLTETAIASIVADAIGGSSDESRPSLAAFIHERTGGNAFYACELFRHLYTTGLIDGATVDDEQLRAHAVPDSVRDVVAARVSRLSADGRAVLDVAALAGTRVEMRVLAAASPPTHDVVAALDELVGAGLVVTVDGPWLSVQFAHVIVRDTVEAAILPAARATTHLRLGDVLERIHEADPRPVLADLARHYLAAAPLGDAKKAVFYARRAAAHALRSLAYDEAVQLLTPVVELTRSQPAERLGVVLDLGEARTRHGRHLEARRAYAEAFQLARDIGDADVAARAAIGFERSSQMPGISGQDAAQMLSTALELLPADESELRLQTEAALASALALSGRREEAAIRLANVFDRARQANDPVSLSSALTAALSLQDEPTRILELCDDLEALTGIDRDPYHLMFALTSKFRVFFILGRLDDVRATLRKHQQAIARGSLVFYRYAARVEAAALAIADADFAAAEANANAARELAAEENGEVGEGLFGLQMFVIRREQGRLHEVLPVARLLASRPTESAGMWAPGIAAIYTELGMMDELRAHLDLVAADGFGAIPRDSLWPVCASFLADASIAAGSKELAGLIAAELRAHAGRNLMAGMTVCVGPADRYLGRLAAFLGDNSSADAHFAEAQEMAQKSGSPLWQAQVLVDRAAHEAPSNPTIARDRAAEALSLAEHHGMTAIQSRCHELLEVHTRSRV